MEKERTLSSGVDTTFKDKDGKAIQVHSYVKDANGNKYYINSHCQAVPEGGEAPAVELRSLLESSEVTVMTAAEVLNAPSPEPRRRRGGRRSKQETPAEETRLPAAQSGQENNSEGLQPVDMRMVLSVIPDNVLAGELRRRGYYLTAVKPAVITL
ncbi:MAG: hypothetical protein J6M31_01685 [Bacteroidales bacterium]|nr:hypothetical protein [Bacteroidales bacterium]MBP3202299.1 hypothetical protein [Bacteroidales bacterium]